MSEYKNFSYEQRPGGTWSVTFPGGGKLKMPKMTEDELKGAIDRLAASQEKSP